MNPLQVDPTTGFLQSTRVDSFDSDKKLKVIQAVRERSEQGKWPGINGICKSLNVSPSAFYEHLDIDPEFKSKYEEALLALEDHCVENLVRQGDSANGVTANIFLLKNRWGKRWNENYNVNLNGGDGALKGLIDKSKGFIDAEIVDTKQLPSGNKE